MTPEQLAEKHWEYVDGVIRAEWKIMFGPNAIELNGLDHHCAFVGHHFKTAFIHGYKHGREDAPMKDRWGISL